MTNNINIVKDTEGKNIVLINDVRFKSRRKINWSEIELFLKEYIGEYFEIAETSEKVYIGPDFPDEFTHSEDTKMSKGGNVKAKSNIPYALPDIVEIATNKTVYPNYNEKHNHDARYGWYRYDVRFGLPVYNENGKVDRYNIYSARMLVRCDNDKKLYLYDFVRIKKETSKPLR